MILFKASTGLQYTSSPKFKKYVFLNSVRQIYSINNTKRMATKFQQGNPCCCYNIQYRGHCKRYIISFLSHLQFLGFKASSVNADVPLQDAQ